MRLFIGRVDQYIIEVPHGEVINKMPQAVVNVTMDVRRGIRQCEEHNPVLELAVTGSKCHLVLVAFLDAHEMVSIPELGPGKNPHSAHTIRHFRDQRNAVSVVYCT